MRSSALFALLTCLLLSCSDAPSGPVLQASWRDHILTGEEPFAVNVAGVAQGEEGSVGDLGIRNVSDSGTLVVTGLSITAEPTDAFFFKAIPGRWLPSSQDPWRLEPNGYKEIDLMYQGRASTTEEAPTATVRVFSNSTGDTPPEFELHLVAEHTDAPRIVVPFLLEFGAVSAGKSASQELVIRNEGLQTLEVTGFTLTADQFTLIDGSQSWQGFYLGTQVDLTPPWTVPAYESHPVRIEFEPRDPNAVHGELRLFSNDPAPKLSSGKLILFEGNLGAPCIAVEPREVDFGGTLVGAVASAQVKARTCGSRPMTIEELRLLADDEVPEVSLSSDFSLDFYGSAGLAEGDEPIEINAGTSVEFTIHFSPDEVSPSDPDGEPIAEQARVLVRNNSYFEELIVEVSGFGVAE